MAWRIGGRWPRDQLVSVGTECRSHEQQSTTHSNETIIINIIIIINKAGVHSGLVRINEELLERQVAAPV
jgi:hypothetical protein